jgi:hypothetical protein
MRILLSILVVLAAGVCMEEPAKAQSGGWCGRTWRQQGVWVCDIATVLGQGARGWRELGAQSVL